MFIIKHFNELSVNEFYEIAKSRYEVFACEQKIVDENDLDDVDKNCYHIFYYDGENVSSYARIIPPNYSPYSETSIGRVLVLKNSRNKGIARKMMISAVNFIHNELKEDNVTLSAQEYIKDLYLSCGFEIISDPYDEVGIPHIKMRLCK